VSHRKFAALVLVLSCVACATEHEPRYADTMPGVVIPGPTIDSTQPESRAFGAPSNIPSPIHVPVRGVTPAFGEPVDMDALYGYQGLGRQGMAEADALKAEFNFERALEVNPFDPVALNNLAVAKAERGQFYAAMALLERAAKLAPDNSAVAANLARLRGYVQSYATADIEPAVTAETNMRSLPQAPPPLWGGTAEVVPATPASIQPTAWRDEYFSSDVCRRATTAKGKVEVICEQTE